MMVKPFTRFSGLHCMGADVWRFEAFVFSFKFDKPAPNPIKDWYYQSPVLPLYRAIRTATGEVGPLRQWSQSSNFPGHDSSPEFSDESAVISFASTQAENAGGTNLRVTTAAWYVIDYRVINESSSNVIPYNSHTWMLTDRPSGQPATSLESGADVLGASFENPSFFLTSPWP